MACENNNIYISIKYEYQKSYINHTTNFNAQRYDAMR